MIDGERVGGLPTLPEGVRFDHVERLVLRNMELSDIEADFLHRFANVRELDLRGNRLGRVPQGLEYLGQLRWLDLSRNHIVMDEAGNTVCAAWRAFSISTSAIMANSAARRT